MDEFNLFRVCPCFIEGLDKIEFLQNHENHEIYQKAFDIIEQYFGSEEEEDRSIAPSAGDQQFNFAADMPDAVPSSGFQFWRLPLQSANYSLHRSDNLVFSAWAQPAIVVISTVPNGS